MSEPTAAQAARITELLDAGLALQAWALAEPLGPPRGWTGTGSRLLAARLHAHLGDRRGGDALALRAWRAAPEDPAAVRAAAQTLLGRRPGLPCWTFARDRRELLLTGEPEDRAHGHGLLAHAAARLRDFSVAESEVDQALAAAPDSPWARVVDALLRTEQDRHEDALARAREALALRPNYRPALQCAAESLVALGRDDEAIASLDEGRRGLESGALLVQLVGLLFEAGERERAVGLLPELERLSPLAGRELRRWSDNLRCDLAAWTGDRAEELRLAEAVDTPFHRQVAENLRAAPAGAPRALLPVPFVQQHHSTCAPATLASICAHWGMPGEHLEVAAEICYDGTPAHRERSWAQDAGWCVREFTIDWDSAVALLERGVPFTLTTVEPGWAHLQAVVGRDEARRTLLLLDPSSRGLREVLADRLLEDAAATGPRGMALVPRAEAQRLEELELPDAELWDEYHRLQAALDAGRREPAGAIADELDRRAPGHRLAILGRLSLADHDANEPGRLRELDRLRALHPDDARVALWRLRSLHLLERKDQRLRDLEELAHRRHAHPSFRIALANELSEDGRRLDEALRHVRAALRRMPFDVQAIDALGRIQWRRREFDEALAAARAASGLSEANEALAQTFFEVHHALGRTDEALAFLEERCERLGSRSVQPAATLAQALHSLGRSQEAEAVLRRAAELRPGDTELALSLVADHRFAGRFDEAQAELERARAALPAGAWLRESALLARLRGDLPGALELRRRALQDEPTAVDLHAGIAELLAELEGPQRAQEHLAQAVRDWPHHLALHRLRVDRLRGEPPARVRPALQALLEGHPHDAWAWRELALIEAQDGRADEAESALREAAALQPREASTHQVRAQLRWNAGRFDEAREAWREALSADVDQGHAIHRLLGTSGDLAERRAVVAFVRARLAEQPSSGEAVEALLEGARRQLEAPELLALAEELHAERPDLPACWSGLAAALADCGRTEDALRAVQQAVDRFPLVGRLRLDLAERLVAAERPGQAVEVLERELQLHPKEPEAARALAGLHRRQGRFEQALEVAQAASARLPLDPTLHAHAALALWSLERRDEAVERLRRALEISPAYDWAWGQLAEWAAVLGDPEIARRPARALARERPGDVAAWLALARVLEDPAELEERVSVLERAIALRPADDELHDERVVTLARLHRFEEAREACRPPAWGERPPVTLRGREAWLLAQLGELEEACRLMRAALEDEPGYQWGWSQLARWHAALDRPDDELAAVRRLAQVAPDDSDALAWLGGLRVERKVERAEGKRDLERALVLDGSNVWAGAQLFEARVEDGESREAEAVLETLRPHLRPEQWLQRRLRLDLASGRSEEAREHLAELARTSADEPAAHRIALEAVAEHAGARVPLEAAFLRAAAGPEGSQEAGAALVLVALATGAGRRLNETLGRLPPGSPAWRGAVITLFEGDTSAASARTGKRLLRRRRKLLREDTRLWGAAGCFLCGLGEVEQAAKWMRDWRQREGVEPWMLQNLAVSRLQAFGPKSALEVAEAALRLPPDHAASDLAVLAAACALARGRLELARAAAGRVAPAELATYYADLWALALAVLETEPREGLAPKASVREGWRRLGACRPKAAGLLSSRGTRALWQALGRRVAARHPWSGVPGWLLRLHWW